MNAEDFDPPEPDEDDYCGPCGGACLGDEVHDQAYIEIVTAVRLGVL
ncbi:hypothetical protein Ait01nite_030430 [Actinoplanes italicus]|uniref:Uncharacterized protein n=1 Tax=Actinoplanes italicus TaxID=113567 RepID=A0A2T0KIZ6_9ACTN|nr:hypothetical protein [Actinoplanes italicus]PRX23502.1 hypothetical protein CLV67_103250 [Actinoplanes italicus]GIE29998.1 hypothetical protein Ait01nite_030430 [Actinoplanes italicus]